MDRTILKKVFDDLSGSGIPERAGTLHQQRGVLRDNERNPLDRVILVKNTGQFAVGHRVFILAGFDEQGYAAGLIVVNIRVGLQTQGTVVRHRHIVHQQNAGPDDRDVTAALQRPDPVDAGGQNRGAVLSGGHLRAGSVIVDEYKTVAVRQISPGPVIHIRGTVHHGVPDNGGRGTGGGS